MTIRSNPPLHVVAFQATRRGDPERGPRVTLSSTDARERLIDAGELVWVHGPRRHEMAQVAIDDTVPRGGVILRDISGVAVSEIVRLEKHRPARA